jgi:outer membrane biosynthesis protein TonB
MPRNRSAPTRNAFASYGDQSMKTSTLTHSAGRILLAVLLATVVTLGEANAAEPLPLAAPAPSVDKERELERQINKYVTYPLMERPHRMDGEVLVSFVIDTEGKVKVINALSANTVLCEYVLRMLAKVDIGDNPDGLWRTTHMRFSFRPEV